MALSSSSSMSSLRSNGGHNFPSTRLARIEESKYEKHQQHQLQQQEERRRGCLLILLLTIAILGLWQLFTRIHNTSDRGTDDHFIQSLRRNPRHAPVIPNEKYHGGMYQQPIQPIQSEKTRKTREERLEEAIQELKKYQADAETREREYQQEVKAQLEDELRTP